jgi:hypothetical protein
LNEVEKLLDNHVDINLALGAQLKALREANGEKETVVGAEKEVVSHEKDLEDPTESPEDGGEKSSDGMCLFLAKFADTDDCIFASRCLAIRAVSRSIQL